MDSCFDFYFGGGGFVDGVLILFIVIFAGVRGN